MCLDFDPTVLPSSLPLARPSRCSQGKEVTNTIVGQGGGGMRQLLKFSALVGSAIPWVIKRP